MNFKVKNFIILQIVMVIFSLSSVFLKISSQMGTSKGIFSAGFIFTYGIAIGLLFAYAILWQLIIKKLDLSLAYSSKAMVVIWSLVWSVTLFNEKITLNNIIGTIIIVIGVVWGLKDG